MSDNTGVPQQRKRTFHREDGTYKPVTKILMSAAPVLLCSAIAGMWIWCGRVSDSCAQQERDHPDVQANSAFRAEQNAVNREILAKLDNLGIETERLRRYLEKMEIASRRGGRK